MMISINVNDQSISSIQLNKLENSINQLASKISISEISKLANINENALKNICELSNNPTAVETLSSTEGMNLVKTFLG